MRRGRAADLERITAVPREEEEESNAQATPGKDLGAHAPTHASLACFLCLHCKVLSLGFLLTWGLACHTLQLGMITLDQCFSWQPAEPGFSTAGTGCAVCASVPSCRCLRR